MDKTLRKIIIKIIIAVTGWVGASIILFLIPFSLLAPERLPFNLGTLLQVIYIFAGAGIIIYWILQKLIYLCKFLR